MKAIIEHDVVNFHEKKKFQLFLHSEWNVTEFLNVRNSREISFKFLNFTLFMRFIKFKFRLAGKHLKFYLLELLTENNNDEQTLVAKTPNRHSKCCSWGYCKGWRAEQALNYSYISLKRFLLLLLCLVYTNVLAKLYIFFRNCF